MQKCKFSPLAMGLAVGVMWGLSVLISGLAAYYYSYGKPFVIAMSSVYIGYNPSISGSFFGALLAFVEGMIAGAVFAGLYNLFSCCPKSCGSSKGDASSCEKPASKRVSKKA